MNLNFGRNSDGVIVDFISWHHYGNDPRRLAAFAATAREMAARYGYGDAEMHLTEWNYMHKWGPAEELRYSMRAFRGQKGGAYVAACMSLLQYGALDKMFYYDARPGQFNGMYNDMMEPLPAYYALSAFSDLAELGRAAAVADGHGRLFAMAAGNAARGAVLLSYFDNDDALPRETVALVVSGLDAGRSYLATATPVGMQKPEQTFVLGPGERTVTLAMDLFDVYRISFIPQ